MGLNKKVVCADGFTISVQADALAYCEPRIDDASSYTHVEMGYPNRSDDLLLEYAEDFEFMPSKDINLKKSIYPYTPVSIVRDMIERHGGMVSGEVPNGVIALSEKRDALVSKVKGHRNKFFHDLKAQLELLIVLLRDDKITINNEDMAVLLEEICNTNNIGE